MGNSAPQRQKSNQFFAVSKADSTPTTPTKAPPPITGKTHSQMIINRVKHKMKDIHSQKIKPKMIKRKNKFAWNEHNTILLCLGYLRQNTSDDHNNISFNDISKILLKFVGFMDTLIIATSNVDYPFHTQYTPFVINSINNNDFNSINYESNCYDASNVNLLCILGGNEINETSFKILNCNCNCNAKSGCNEYNTQFNDAFNGSLLAYKRKIFTKADLEYIGINCGKDIMSFFIKDSKSDNYYILIINCDKDGDIGDVGYNVYSINNDNWLYEKNQKDVFENKFDSHARALLFDESLVIYYIVIVIIIIMMCSIFVYFVKL